MLMFLVGSVSSESRIAMWDGLLGLASDVGGFAAASARHPRSDIKSLSRSISILSGKNIRNETSIESSFQLSSDLSSA